MPTGFYKFIVKTGEFALMQLPALYAAHYRTTARSPEVNCKVIFCQFHFIFWFLGSAAKIVLPPAPYLSFLIL